MKICVVHGQNHRGNTYRLTQLLLEQLSCEKENIKEFYVGGIGQCTGCTQCILKDEKLCPHRLSMKPIVEALEEADVIILASPNYCMGMTGQLKNFCDHLGYRWMSHRPFDMRKKIGVGISTTAGMGAGKTAKELCKQLFWWSIGRTFSLSFTVNAIRWEEISEKRILKLNRKVQRLARRINSRYGKVHQSLKSRAMFKIMTLMHRNMEWNEIETAYWKANDWI